MTLLERVWLGVAVVTLFLDYGLAFTYNQRAQVNGQFAKAQYLRLKHVSHGGTKEGNNPRCHAPGIVVEQASGMDYRAEENLSYPICGPRQIPGLSPVSV